MMGHRNVEQAALFYELPQVMQEARSVRRRKGFEAQIL